MNDIREKAQRLLALHEKATPGMWSVSSACDSIGSIEGSNISYLMTTNIAQDDLTFFGTQDDLRFVAVAHEYVPEIVHALVAALDVLARIADGRTRHGGFGFDARHFFASIEGDA